MFFLFESKNTRHTHTEHRERKKDLIYFHISTMHEKTTQNTNYGNISRWKSVWWTGNVSRIRTMTIATTTTVTWTTITRIRALSVGCGNFAFHVKNIFTGWRATINFISTHAFSEVLCYRRTTATTMTTTQRWRRQRRRIWVHSTLSSSCWYFRYLCIYCMYVCWLVYGSILYIRRYKFLFDSDVTFRLEFVLATMFNSGDGISVRCDVRRSLNL